jgi:hypothetical protein
VGCGNSVETTQVDPVSGARPLSTDDEVTQAAEDALELLRNANGPNELHRVLVDHPACRDMAHVQRLLSEAESAPHHFLAEHRTAQAAALRDFLECIDALSNIDGFASLIAVYADHDAAFSPACWELVNTLSKDVGAKRFVAALAEKRSLEHLLDEALKVKNSPDTLEQIFTRTPGLASSDFHEWLRLRHRLAINYGSEDEASAFAGLLDGIKMLSNFLASRRSEEIGDGRVRVTAQVADVMSQSWASSQPQLDEVFDPIAKSIAAGRQKCAPALATVLTELSNTPNEAAFYGAYFLERCLKEIGDAAPSHILDGYRALCELSGVERDNRATTVLRYSVAVLFHWRTAGLDADALFEVAELVREARATLPSDKRPRLLRDLDFRHAQLLENVAIWRPELLEHARQSYVRGLAITAVAHESESRGGALGGLASILSKLSSRGEYDDRGQIEALYREALTLQGRDDSSERCILLNNYAVHLLERAEETQPADAERALELIEEAIPVAVKLAGISSWFDQAIANLCLTRGNVLRDRWYGDRITLLRAALDSYRSGRRYAVDSSELQGLLLLNQSFVAAELAAETSDEQARSEAEYAIEQACGVLSGRPIWSAVAEFTRSTITPRTTLSEDALAAARSAVEALSVHASRRELARRQVELSRALKARGDVPSLQEAASILRSALASYRQLGDRERMLSLLRDLAALALETGEGEGHGNCLTTAEHLLTEAVQIADDLYSTASSIEGRLVLGYAATAHAELAWLKAKRGAPLDELLPNVILAKNRELIEHTRLFTPGRPVSSDPRSAQARREARAREMQLWNARAEVQPTQTLGAEGKALQQALSAAREVEAVLLGPADLPDATKIAATLMAATAAPSCTVIVDVTVTRWGTVGVRFSSDGVTITTSTLSTDDLADAKDSHIGRWREAYHEWRAAGAIARAGLETKVNEGLETVLRHVREKLGTIGDWLTAPGIDLMIVPGALAGLPIHALPVKLDDALRIIDTAASTTYAMSLARCPTDAFRWQRPERALCILSDPGTERPRLVKSVGEVSNIVRYLSDLGAEVDVIATVANESGTSVVSPPAGNIRVHSGHATVDAVRKTLPHVDAFVYSGHGMPSGLLLADENGAEAMMRIPALLGMDLATRRPFIHLSACSTAQEMPGTLDSFSLVSCFLRIGAAAVFGGLWEVRESVAANVSSTLYGASLQKRPVARAIADSIKLVRNELGDRDLMGWAPFAWFVGPR